MKSFSPHSPFVIPAQAGIQSGSNRSALDAWTPAFAGVTVFVASTLSTNLALVFAQDSYPTRSIRMVIPYPPGGGTDIVGRMVAQKLTETLGHTVVVDNRGGATGNIGTEIVARAAPDGYTLLMGNVAPNAINVSLFAKIPYDPVNDFEPVSLVALTPNILIVHPSLPVKTVKEFVALAKVKPGTLNYSSAGIGSSSHLAPELLAMMTGIQIVHVPYKGGGPGLVDLLSGQMQFMMTTTPAAMPHVKSGRVRALGVTSAHRSQSLPDLPTIAEAGVKGYEVSTWYGVLAPARTAKPIVSRLHGEIVKLLAVPDTNEKLLAQGFEPVGNTPDEFGAYIKSEIAKWAKVIKTARIKAE
jgi:tripartite-type tricarboxylate transporter receptor subunit TctC